MSWVRPTFSSLKNEYEKYRGAGRVHPCKDSTIKNQCAVRMSLALVRNGFSLDYFPFPSRLHRFREICALGDTPHVVAADELNRYLLQVWGAASEGKGVEILKAIKGKPGIIYFNNCFKRRKNDPIRRGDHIDLWTGGTYYNLELVASAGIDPRPGADLFRRADYVRFFWLPS